MDRAPALCIVGDLGVIRNALSSSSNSSHDARVQAVIGLDLDGHTVETVTVGLVRHLYVRNILSMKLCPIRSLNGLYCPETFADKAAQLPTPDRIFDFDQRKVI